MREAAFSPAHLASSCRASLPSPPGEDSPVHQFAAHLGGELLPPRFAASSATFLPSIRPRATTWGFVVLGIRGDYNATRSAARKVVRRVFDYYEPAYDTSRTAWVSTADKTTENLLAPTPEEGEGSARDGPATREHSAWLPDRTNSNLARWRGRLVANLYRTIEHGEGLSAGTASARYC